MLHLCLQVSFGTKRKQRNEGRPGQGATPEEPGDRLREGFGPPVVALAAWVHPRDCRAMYTSRGSRERPDDDDAGEEEEEIKGAGLPLPT
mmetsp:Transcript_4201/g.8006  ORF Transcript_4201/g.8006 Transcript_4201/m.8006 type:complete len:90 (+) Transcript_4201:91-360(+)